MEKGKGPETDYDVIVIGGSLAGASSALLLRRQFPDLRVLILEKSNRLGRRVGEATVEISAYFLSRVLGLTQYLNEAHLVKQGLRFWFSNSATEKLDECSEIGGRYLARVPAYQVDRSTLDEEVLRRAVAGGVTVWRPATVQRVQLAPGGLQKVSVRHQDQTWELKARWVVDASGVAAFLARQEGWWVANREHPTTAVWSRWRNVKDWDGIELAEKYPSWSKACYGIRGTATNHFMGDGWWAWCIPLKGGDFSIGVVFDQRLVRWPEGGSIAQRLKQFLSAHPVARELLADAEWQEGDVHWRKQLPYFCGTVAGDGFCLVGDAAGFIDPFYSPGMDWLAYTVCSAVELIAMQKQGEDIAERIQWHNATFTRSARRWFEGLYKDKYEYMGDFELMRIAFLLDLGLYYLGVASQPFLYGNKKAFSNPVFSSSRSVPVFHLMRLYNRRLARMARSRRQRNVLGLGNKDQRFMFPGFTLSPTSARPIVGALLDWLSLEIREGWRSWWKESPPSPGTEAVPAAAVK